MAAEAQELTAAQISQIEDDLGKRLKNNLVWFALGMLVLGGAGMLGIQQYLRAFVDDRIQTNVTLQPIEERVSALESGSAELEGQAEGLAAQISSDLTTLRDQVSELEKMEGVPKGAVIAVDFLTSVRDVQCPNGWERFEDAEGRFIVGALPKEDKDPGDFEPRDEGGTATIALTQQHLPPHAHRLDMTKAVKGYSAGPEEKGRVIIGMPISEADQAARAIEAHSGDATPFDNMPPYYALIFCKNL